MMCLQVRFFFPGFLSLSKLYVSLTSNTALHITFVSLRLDLTVNFVSVEEIEESFHLRAMGPWGTAVARQIPSCQGVYNLKANMMLEDLYLTGNPCKNLSKLQGGAGSCWRVKAAGMLGMMFFSPSIQRKFLRRGLVWMQGICHSPFATWQQLPLVCFFFLMVIQ